MSSGSALRVSPRAVLAGDGGLLTAAVFGAVVALGALGSGSHVSNVAGIAGTAAGIALAPWTLHGRRVDRAATMGAVVGYIAGGVVVYGVLTMSAVVGTVVSLFITRSAGPIAVVAAVAVAFLVTIVWLDVKAVRDLSPTRRRHVRLDLTRLVATAAYAAFCAGVIAKVAGGSDPDAGVYAAVLLLAPGAVGALVVTVADATIGHDERRSCDALGADVGQRRH